MPPDQPRHSFRHPHAPTRPANAPPKHYSASTPPRNRSRSHTSPAQQACLGPGSTASPICEPTSTGSAELPQPRLSPFHHLNEDQPNRCDNALRPPSTRSPDSTPTTTSSENTSPSTSATGAKTASPPRQRHVSHMKPKLRTTTASSPPDKHQQPAPSAQAHRPRLHQPHQLPSPRTADNMTRQPVPATLNPTLTRRAHFRGDRAVLGERWRGTGGVSHRPAGSAGLVAGISVRASPRCDGVRGALNRPEGCLQGLTAGPGGTPAGHSASALGKNRVPKGGQALPVVATEGSVGCTPRPSRNRIRLRHPKGSLGATRVRRDPPLRRGVGCTPRSCRNGIRI